MEVINKYNEEELVALLQNQDKQAFSYLYDNYAPALNNIIFRMVEDVTLSEDILQEAFVKIWHNFTSYDKSMVRFLVKLSIHVNNLPFDLS